jgi:hypothetical protein
MMPLQNCRIVHMLEPAAVATNSDSTGVVDTLGFEEASIAVMLTGTTNLPTTMKLQESDITDATGYADIVGAVGGTNDGFVFSALTSNAPNVAVANLDLRKRKRYIRAVLRAATATQTSTVVAVLGKAKDSTVARGGMKAVVDV